MKSSVVFGCHGNASEHCCYQAGVVCPYLEEGTVAGRRWVCGLLRRYGSWEAMNTSPEYVPIGEYWASRGNPFNYCETFDPAFCCRPEFRMGRNNEKSVPSINLVGWS